MSGEGVDEAGWATEPGDEMAPMVEVVGSLIRFHREAAGMRTADFGEAMGYGEDLIRKVERGARIPRVDFLCRADEVLGAGGAIASMRRHVEQARYPKKLRQLAQMEDRAAELLLYNNHHIHGLLRTKEYAEAMFGVRRPAHSKEALEQAVEARMARQSVFECDPAPDLSFVQEQATLERPVGGNNRSATAARTAPAGGSVAARGTPGDADRLVGSFRAERPDRAAEVRGRHSGGALRRGVQRPSDLRSETPQGPRTAIRNHPGPGSFPRGVGGLHRARAWRIMSTSNLRWFKSSYSSGPEVDDCVEIAVAPATVHVRDSKNPAGPRLTLGPAAWSSFVTALPTAP